MSSLRLFMSVRVCKRIIMAFNIKNSNALYIKVASHFLGGSFYLALKNICQKFSNSIFEGKFE